MDGPYPGASMVSGILIFSATFLKKNGWVLSQRVLEAETYMYDIKEANLQGSSARPQYFKLYDSKKDLGMKNLFPEEWDQLARRMVTDDELYAKFFK